MAKYVVLTEKPSAAKNYASALGGMKGNFNGMDYEIVNSVGHICELLPPEDQVDESLKERYHSWNTDYLPWNPADIAWKKRVNPEFKDTFAKIKDAINGCDNVVIATDNDPTGEGTLLADEIILSVRPRGKHFFRCFTEDESKNSIQKAMKNLTDLGTNPLTDPDYKKANFRSRWDFLSMQWTRVFTKLGDGRSVLRQGRLKSYMVWVVGEQLALASGYKKIPYYENRFKDENGNIFSNKEETKYPKKEDVPNIYHTSDVVLDGKEVKYTAPPKLYDLAALSAALAPKGYKAKDVLETYQRMYNDSVVSYPRTEDKQISNEQFIELRNNVPKIAHCLGLDMSLFTHKTARTTHVTSEGLAHGANRPGTNVPSSLDEVETKYGRLGRTIYEFVARNSLSMFCEDYSFEHQTAHLKDYPKFKASSNIPLKPGYKAIFNDEKNSSKDAEEENSKEIGARAEPFVHEGFPKAPQWPTFKWLVKNLEKEDIGTGATRTSIYAETQSGKYPLLTDTNGKIDLTNYGKMSHALLKDTHIGEVKLTAGLQEQMKRVAEGESPDDFLNEIADLIREDIESVKRNASEAGFKEVATSVSENKNSDFAVKCPKCGKPLRLTDKGVSCTGYRDGCTYGIYRIVCGKKIDAGQLKKLITKGKTDKISGFKTQKADAKHKTFSAYLTVDSEGKTKLNFS